ncbi:MAG TPA: 8-amino-7-oxononanoate synthase [Acidimicrobiales bacterium]|nr:8-amino-7-oxononanoate synthase [Acidimicrobiales bacterium]
MQILNPGGEWARWLDAETSSIRRAGRWRELRTLDGGSPNFKLPDGSHAVSFASNDYLGLSLHPAVISAAQHAVARWGAGAGASRLVVGSRPVHEELEEALASWRAAEAALVFPTGYQANIAVLAALGGGTRIVSDELNHASIIDGARLSRAEVTVYRHRDVDHAAELVRSAGGRVLVVSDTVFSMDGDLAPVQGLSEMCARHGALLVLDDAHAVFEAEPVHPDADCLRVGTLSKALGSQGGYVVGTRRWVHLLVNRARPFIFTTALAPASAAAALAAVSVCQSGEGRDLRAALRRNVDAVRSGHASPIIAVVLGSEEAAVGASNRLLEEGLLVPAIRPPTVPPGTSRLRVALSAAHAMSDVRRLGAALDNLATSLT